MSSMSAMSFLCFVDVMCYNAGWKREVLFVLLDIGPEMVGECKVMALRRHHGLDGRS